MRGIRNILIEHNNMISLPIRSININKFGIVLILDGNSEHVGDAWRKYETALDLIKSRKQIK